MSRQDWADRAWDLVELEKAKTEVVRASPPRRKGGCPPSREWRRGLGRRRRARARPVPQIHKAPRPTGRRRRWRRGCRRGCRPPSGRAPPGRAPRGGGGPGGGGGGGGGGG